MSDERGVAFERALTELEGIVEELERGEPGLDEALELFERGVTRLRAARRLLEDARGRVEELVEEASGELGRVPLDSADEGPEPTGSPGKD